MALNNQKNVFQREYTYNLMSNNRVSNTCMYEYGKKFKRINKKMDQDALVWCTIQIINVPIFLGLFKYFLEISFLLLFIRVCVCVHDTPNTNHF